MKGELVIREPKLVLLGTTSLYGIASSQYNRLRAPASALGSAARQDVEFKLLGRTEGFGSFNFSNGTINLGERIASQSRDGRRVNSIFGEGVNPKMRKLREALARAGFPTERVLRHGSPRLVYGAALAENFREVLLGKTSRPHYVLWTKRAEDGTRQLARFWRVRWLANRIKHDDIVNAVSTHSLVRPVRHGARVLLPSDANELSLFHYDE
jgi:hypothetical protein